MKKNLILNSLLILIMAASVSCKIKQNVDDLKNKDVVNIDDMKTDEARNFTASELEIGRRVCSNLKKKRLFFSNLQNNVEKFRLRGEVANCDGGIWYNSDFDVTIRFINSIDPEYDSLRDSKTYFRDVETDQSGMMRSMCDSLIQNETIPNNIFSSNYKFSFKFLIADGFDTYQIMMTQKNASGRYDPVSADVVSIYGPKNPGPTKFYGVEKDHIRKTICDEKRFTTIKQSWVSALTNF